MTVHKTKVICIAFLLSLASVSSASIIQDQLMSLGATNGVLIGGAGFNFGESINVVTANNSQYSSSPSGDVQAFQYQDGTHVQVAIAAGEGGTFGVDQIGNSTADQSEFVGDDKTAVLDQNVGVGMNQDMAANGGYGIVGAIDGYRGHQLQATFSREGMNVNVTKVDIWEQGVIIKK